MSTITTQYLKNLLYAEAIALCTGTRESTYTDNGVTAVYVLNPEASE